MFTNNNPFILINTTNMGEQNMPYNLLIEKLQSNPKYQSILEEIQKFNPKEHQEEIIDILNRNHILFDENDNIVDNDEPFDTAGGRKKTRKRKRKNKKTKKGGYIYHNIKRKSISSLKKHFRKNNKNTKKTNTSSNNYTNRSTNKSTNKSTRSSR